MPRAPQYVFSFDQSGVETPPEGEALLGAKGAGLARMRGLGLPVPAGFTLSSDSFVLFGRDPRQWRERVWPQVEAALARLEETSGARFGAGPRPLLLALRAGACLPTTGILEPVLGIGLSAGLVAEAGSREDPYLHDCYRRFLQQFGTAVLGLAPRRFERILAGRRRRQGIRHDIELGWEAIQDVCGRFLELIEGEGKELPQEPTVQLRLALEALYRRWEGPEAKAQRRVSRIPEGTSLAATVQQMVFGNRARDSGSGIGYTRDPTSGEARICGEFLPRSQGGELVVGTRTPLGLEELARFLPQAYAELEKWCRLLEQSGRDMQCFEFAVEQGQLYMLQTERGRRSGPAALRIACDLHAEGLLERETAVSRVGPEQVEQLLRPQFPEIAGQVLARGLPASPGAAVGRIALTADEALTRAHHGEAVILVRRETRPSDLHGMQVCEGILTARGGMTSHAAVVARGMGKCCVVGCDALEIDEERGKIRLGDRTFERGDWIALDGTRGKVLPGEASPSEVEGSTSLLEEFMELVSGMPALPVRANADNAAQAVRARRSGAAGIGLCRTEHMFLDPERLPVMQELLLSENPRERDKLLGQLKDFQRIDFLEILEVMDGLPVAVRLLDPPLHEFLPAEKELVGRIEAFRGQAEASPRSVVRAEKLLRRLGELREVNPMMGQRGCRLGIRHPEITRIQVEALFEAACRLKKGGKSPLPEVMVPLVSMVEEFRDQAAVIRESAARVFEAEGLEVPYRVGSMIELPRAALTAGEIARESDFFSFGTNDLTQATFGFSRDDAASFIQSYRRKGILERDPFETLDLGGVGELMRQAVSQARAARPEIELGVCGEHAGDPRSIEFFASLGLDYLSCPPPRIPIARLAAAQAGRRGSDPQNSKN